MSEFSEVVKQLERMCNTYHAVSGKCGTDECRLYCEDLCYAQTMIHVHGDDACKLEKVVMAWAAEHPDPVYPTWEDFLENVGLGEFVSGTARLAWLRETHIPADIAQKLGIEPKEG